MENGQRTMPAEFEDYSKCKWIDVCITDIVKLNGNFSFSGLNQKSKLMLEN